VAVLDLAKTSPLPTNLRSVLGEGPGVRAGLMLADIGTGSGIIAVCLAKHLPAARLTAIDISPAALSVARGNAEEHGVADRIEFLQSDLFTAMPPGRQFDFIVSKPPYITAAELDKLAPDVRKYEPKVALLAGPQGTEVIARLIPQAADRLRPGGHLLMEINPAIHDAVHALLKADGRFELGPTIKDLARLPRVIQTRMKQSPT
jgi:release factor glutamine methyltransferase